MTETATVERSGTWQMRRWCPVGCMHQDAEDHQCNGCDPVHYLRLRRMLICSVCEMGFFKQAGFDEHECWDAY